MEIYEVSQAIKDIIDADPFFAGVAQDGFGVVLCDDLLPAAASLADAEEYAANHIGVSIVMKLMGGDPQSDDESPGLLNTLRIGINENPVINRANGGFGSNSQRVMHEVKRCLAEAIDDGRFFTPGLGDALRLRGWESIDPEAVGGLVAYDLIYEVTTP